MKKIIAGITLSLMLAICFNLISGGVKAEQMTPKEAKNEAVLELTDKQVVKLQQTQKEEPKQDSTYLGQFKITYYCPCCECSDNWGTKTATGSKATLGRTIAVDPDVIPLGSKVVIGSKEYIAEDVGGKVKGKVIDIYVDTHSEVNKGGVTHSNVYVKR